MSSKFKNIFILFDNIVSSNNIFFAIFINPALAILQAIVEKDTHTLSLVISPLTRLIISLHNISSFSAVLHTHTHTRLTAQSSNIFTAILFNPKYSETRNDNKCSLLFNIFLIIFLIPNILNCGIVIIISIGICDTHTHTRRCETVRTNS
eukprot:GHVR01007902.1.p1 GENE.GHVR01007902.1~~GHVR01007902.1.p1  ORF type:complete len:150 (+),score=53.48 GHVR01007902.1:203-652(+)